MVTPNDIRKFQNRDLPKTKKRRRDRKSRPAKKRGEIQNMPLKGNAELFKLKKELEKEEK